MPASDDSKAPWPGAIDRPLDSKPAAESETALPIMVLASANDRIEADRSLRNLPKERRAILQQLKGCADVRVVPDATLEEVWEVLDEASTHGRLRIFHFAGHASGSWLAFDSEAGAPSMTHAEALARFLGRLEGLVLVFLNACSTHPQVERLRQGVPAVVATTDAILDVAAAELAERFYMGLRSHPLERAFLDAVDFMKAKYGDDPREVLRRELAREDDDSVEWPWILDCDDAYKMWRLGQEAPARNSRTKAPKRQGEPLVPPQSVGSDASDRPLHGGPGFEPAPSREADCEALEAERAQWRREVIDELVRLLESTRGLRGCLGKLARWQAAALAGHTVLAAAIVAEASPVELVDGLFEAMTWLDANPDGARVAEGLRKVLLRVLPVVGGPCVTFERESAHMWVMNVGFDWMVEFRIAYHDRRPIDGPEWRSKAVLPSPTALVSSHHGEIPEFGMDGVRRVEDAARAIVDRSNPIERDDRLHTMATRIIAKQDLRYGNGIPPQDMIDHAANIVRRAGERRGRRPPKTYYTVLDEQTEGDGLSVIAELIDTKLGVRVIVPRMQPEDRATTSLFRDGLSDFFKRYLELIGAASS